MPSPLALSCTTPAVQTCRCRSPIDQAKQGIKTKCPVYTPREQPRFNERVDLRYLGATNVEQWTVGIQRGLDFRDDGHDDLFYDIGFRAMQTDPIGEVRGLYDWLGEPVTPEFEAGMRAWWREYSRDREKNTHPDPAEFGLDPAAIRPLFADYIIRSQQWVST